MLSLVISPPCARDRLTASQIDETTGISKVDGNLKDQLLFVEGTAAPSSIVAAIQGTGRDAVLRGSGSSNSECPRYCLVHNQMKCSY